MNVRVDFLAANAAIELDFAVALYKFVLKSSQPYNIRKLQIPLYIIISSEYL